MRSLIEVMSRSIRWSISKSRTYKHVLIKCVIKCTKRGINKEWHWWRWGEIWCDSPVVKIVRRVNLLHFIVAHWSWYWTQSFTTILQYLWKKRVSHQLLIIFALNLNMIIILLSFWLLVLLNLGNHNLCFSQLFILLNILLNCNLFFHLLTFLAHYHLILIYDTRLFLSKLFFNTK